MGDADRLDVPTEYRERPPSDLPTEWTSWVDVNLGRNPKCGASLLVTLLERGFHPLPSIQAVGDISLSLEAGDHTIKTVEICVLIASYRDPDCAPTLADLFAQAAHPERIRVAVVSQEEKGDRLKTSLIPKAHHAQIGIRRVKSTSSQGVCWARHLGQQMVGQEPFILQLDSHMRFEPGWDLLLLATWIHCQDSRAVLTAYPAGHTPGGTRESGVFYGMAAKQFNQDGVLLFTGCPRFVDGETVPIRPLPGAFVSANFLFAPAESVRQVPYDPSLYFFGEEVSYAARLWTHGFNLYHPNRAILYHDWDRARRVTHFEDHRDWTNRDRISKARVRALLGVLGEDGSPPSAMDLGGYVLGEQRSLADYERWSGVSFSTRQIAKSATDCVFPAPESSVLSLSGSSASQLATPTAHDLLSVLAERLTTNKSISSVFALQIGAMDGVQFDPLRPLIIKHAWNALLVEPLPDSFAALQRNYQDVPGIVFANCAISDSAGVLPLYHVPPRVVHEHGLPAWVLGVSSLSRDHVEAQEVFFNSSGFTNLMSYVEVAEVKVLTMKDLLDSHGSPVVDVLQIDAEGHDFKILSQWDFTACKPSIINLEYARLSRSERALAVDLLLSTGYVIHGHGLDLTAFDPRLLPV